MRPQRHLVLLLTGSLYLAGCVNPWAKNFESNPLLANKFPPTQQVEMRIVEFERLANYEKAEHKLRVESSTAPEDFTTEQRLQAKQRLLEALQLKERGDEIQILGWSRFVDTDQLDLRGKQLRMFAMEIGADVVVASGVYAGQMNRIVDYPLTSYSYYYTTGRGWRGRGGAPYSGTSNSTTWVPMVVTENHYYYQAVFLRRSHTSATTKPSMVSAGPSAPQYLHSGPLTLRNAKPMS